MKQILYTAILIVCMSVNCVYSQPTELTRMDLTKVEQTNPNLMAGLYSKAYTYRDKMHCNGWYIGEYMLAGGGALALAGGAMLYANQGGIKNGTFNQQVPVGICVTGCAIFSLGITVFRYSWLSEHGRRFVFTTNRNSLGMAYQF